MSTGVGTAEDASRAIDAVAAHATEWKDLPHAQKAQLLEECAARVPLLDLSDFMVGNARVQQFLSPPGSPGIDAEMEDAETRRLMALDTVCFLALLNGCLKKWSTLLRQLAEKGTFPVPKIVESANGKQNVVQVGPLSWKDQLNLMGGADTFVHLSQPLDQGFEDEVAGTALVLGAGNQNFLSFVDVLQQMVAANRTCVLKHHPLREFLHPVYESILKPLSDKGYFCSMVVKDPAVAASIVSHPKLCTVHLTGGANTYKALRPAVRGQFTSELGCVTPWLVVPASGGKQWTEKELNHHAKHLAFCTLANGSANCLAPKVVVLPREWSQKQAFVNALEESFGSLPHAPAYYPGATQRWNNFRKQYPDAKEIRGPKASPVQSQTSLPLLLVGPVDGQATDKEEMVFRDEAFAPVFAIVELPGGAPGTDAKEFLDAAVSFCNDKLWGSLSCTLLVHPSTEEIEPQAVRKAEQELLYGCVCENCWSVMGYGEMAAPWGGHPAVGDPAGDPSSGSGYVKNCFMLKNVEKSVVRVPFMSPAKQLGTTPNPPPAVAEALVPIFQGKVGCFRGVMKILAAVVCGRRAPERSKRTEGSFAETDRLKGA